ncbi:MAG: ATP-dependent protease ATPase subunit HslU [Rickettsiales bacterium]|nr:ATP-dependent protease ATPase subunit HslU [Rickettsiales bacterium]
MKNKKNLNLKAKRILKNALTPKQIVAELDRFIIGQNLAKKAVAIALRNRYRRKAVEEDSLRDEIVPKNMLMIGPTGVGKTEIARRLAKLAEAPFIKIEATKFTEVGYVGRDVDSIVRDLMDIAVNMLKTKSRRANHAKAKANVEERIIEVLVGQTSTTETKEKFKKMLQEGELDKKEIEIKVRETKKLSPMIDIPGSQGGQMGIVNLGEMLGKALGSGDRTKKKKLTVKEAREILFEEEIEKLIDEEVIIFDAKELVEKDGIVFLDEIDKIASNVNTKGGDVSREGVQRDLLPLIEGTTVSTKYGSINTEHILFIASGAFHIAKPSDLLPELQGRLPIRVELSDLEKNDMVRILKEPEASLIKQYTALISTEGVNLKFTDDAIEQIAEIAITINKEVENIGARRLHTLIEKLLEEISFTASDCDLKELKIDKNYVTKHLSKLTTQIDLSKFIL